MGRRARRLRAAAARTASAAASGRQAPRAPQAGQPQDPRKLTVFPLRTRHGGVTSRAGVQRRQAASAALRPGPASSLRRDTPRPASAGAHARRAGRRVPAVFAGWRARADALHHLRAGPEAGMSGVDGRGRATGTGQTSLLTGVGRDERVLTQLFRRHRLPPLTCSLPLVHVWYQTLSSARVTGHLSHGPLRCATSRPSQSWPAAPSQTRPPGPRPLQPFQSEPRPCKTRPRPVRPRPRGPPFRLRRPPLRRGLALLVCLLSAAFS